MTDDKVGSEEEYTHNDALCSEFACEVCGYNRGYAAGRKAERERCADIAEGYFNARGRVVAKAIRGGQDAK